MEKFVLQSFKKLYDEVSSMEQTGGFFGFLEKNVMGPLGKVSQYKIVRGIMGAGVATIPFTIVGSLFLVFDIIPVAFPALSGFFDSAFAPFSALYMTAFSASMGVLGLYFCLALAYNYTKIIADEEELKLDALNGALLALFAFLMSLPHFFIEDGIFVNSEAGWERLGTAGVFTAIILSILAVQIYRICIKYNWTIKMPEEVPEGVARSFTALIPAAVVAFVIIILNGIMIALGTNLFDIVAWPFGFARYLTDSVLGIIVIYFLIHALWIVGIHGANVIGPLVGPIALNNLGYNMDRMQAIADGYAGASEMPFFVWADGFQAAYVVAGGSGATMGLLIYMLFMAKSKQLKILGKASAGSSIFNINEPIIFGVPMIYNPMMAIPFFMAPIISAVVATLAIQLQIIPPIVATFPWPTPMVLNAFIGSGGSIMAALVSLLSIVISFVVYLPFARAYDKKLVAEEQENAAAAA